MKIAVIGSGYVGLVAATCFAETGNHVICVDIDEQKIENLKKGIIPIYEPGLEPMIQKNVEDRRLFFTTNLPEAVAESLVLFIAVGTPSGEDGSADLQYVLAVARSIGLCMDSYKIIVDKSTVPVGTAEKVQAAIAQALQERGVDIEFDVVSNPEFLKEGAAIDDFMKPDRVVIGAENVRTLEIMKELYSPFMMRQSRIITMDVRSAEMTKYAANAMLATRISFMNEIANLCDLVGADVSSVREGIGSDSRIGHSFLYPGVGYGGSCFPKDVKAIMRTAREHGMKLQVLDAVEEVNKRQKEVLVDKVLNHYNTSAVAGALKGRHFAVWGLSFKANTDDMRESSSIVIIRELLRLGATICAYDPEAMDEARKIFGDAIHYAAGQYETLENADGLLIITEWNEFRRPDFERIKQSLKEPFIADGRNLYSPEKMQQMGFTYRCIGRDRTPSGK
ncbi:nucleotide sugar dehydrogenase [Desulfurispirillum indicum S5]|uniref:UDP-glucose 6-dehydrogenase n=1 Tax=Desulfurispirillum indicum (strain ATCC BAA-1389 / DSM 22839 / S5) TaxID=653733 RepID=E6W1S8_DESIS|nr:UDP-glucose/GDP-mannose dehydrogenase family protein [Desulfurispirillum indicum]ADU65460.1 nucleotide sugar dehydrogenase [Desulfurispirillum indicum S5]